MPAAPAPAPAAVRQRTHVSRAPAKTRSINVGTAWTTMAISSSTRTTLIALALVTTPRTRTSAGSPGKTMLLADRIAISIRTRAQATTNVTGATTAIRSRWLPNTRRAVIHTARTSRMPTFQAATPAVTACAPLRVAPASTPACPSRPMAVIASVAASCQPRVGTSFGSGRRHKMSARVTLPMSPIRPLATPARRCRRVSTPAMRVRSAWAGRRPRPIARRRIPLVARPPWRPADNPVSRVVGQAFIASRAAAQPRRPE
jgi:hypothetical protein